eukprot:24921_1
MASTPNVGNKNTLAFVDFEFVISNHNEITEEIVNESIINGMNNCLATINLDFNEKGLKISEFAEKRKMIRINGWFSCNERQREKYLKALQKVMTDKSVSKIIAAKSCIKNSKIKIGQLMIKFSNEFDVEMPSVENTQSIPDKYLKNKSFRSKLLKQNEQDTQNEKQNENSKEEQKTDTNELK